MSGKLTGQLRRAAEAGRAIQAETALAILRAPAGDMADILAAADRMRRRRFGNVLHHCSIVNARSGACGEDCAYCAQAARHKTGAAIFGLRKGAEILAARKEATRWPVERFGIVTSGGALSADGVQRICQAMRRVRSGAPSWCASLGCLDRDQLRKLQRAGMKRYHHNLETAESFFPRICTTHRYADRVATVRAAKEIGLQVCSGGILGLGESPEQRVEFALALARERVDSVPLNFLIAIPGTRLERQPPMKPLEILRTIAMFRMVLPRAEIKVCAGRNHLRDLQSMVFYAGATGIMIGRLLTVAGRDVAQDLQMLRDLEMDHAR